MLYENENNVTYSTYSFLLYNIYFLRFSAGLDNQKHFRHNEQLCFSLDNLDARKKGKGNGKYRNFSDLCLLLLDDACFHDIFLYVFRT